ncbi:MAG: RNA-binding protein [Verrucomicrobiales bacterium]|nr:RNA-binding protein [Verrucomicrobiales bacterium]
MKLFIGNLSYDTTEFEVKDLFEPYGTILEFARPIDRETGRPRGFAFVTLADAEVGLKAIEELDGKSVAGRKLKVNEAEERSRPPVRRFSNNNDDVTEQSAPRVDDRPTDKRGKKVVYKSI